MKLRFLTTRNRTVSCFGLLLILVNSLLFIPGSSGIAQAADEVRDAKKQALGWDPAPLLSCFDETDGAITGFPPGKWVMRTGGPGVILEDTFLTGNLDCRHKGDWQTSPAALYVGASGTPADPLTLNLCGHTIQGNFVGIWIDGHRHVEITDDVSDPGCDGSVGPGGTLKGFGTGVLIRGLVDGRGCDNSHAEVHSCDTGGTSRARPPLHGPMGGSNVVSNLTLENMSEDGILIMDSDLNTIEGNTIRAGEDPQATGEEQRVGRFSGIRIGSTFGDNAWGSHGFDNLQSVSHAAHGNKILGNTIIGVDKPVIHRDPNDSSKLVLITNLSTGIELPSGAAGNQVIGNFVAASGLDGIGVSIRSEQREDQEKGSGAGSGGLQVLGAIIEATRQPREAAGLTVPLSPFSRVSGPNEIKDNVVVGNGFVSASHGIPIPREDFLYEETGQQMGLFPPRNGDGIRVGTEGALNLDSRSGLPEELNGPENIDEVKPKTTAGAVSPITGQVIIENNLVCGNSGNGISSGPGAHVIKNNHVGSGSPKTSDVPDGILKNAIDAASEAVDDGLLDARYDIRKGCARNGDPQDRNKGWDLYDSTVGSGTVKSSGLANPLADQTPGEIHQLGQGAYENVETSCGADVYAGNFTKEDRVNYDCVKKLSEADVSIALSGAPSGPVNSPTPIGYSLTIRNNGPNRADRVTVDSTLHYEGYQPAPTTTTCPGTCPSRGIPVTREGAKVKVDLGTLGPDKSRSVQIPVVPIDGGTLIHEANVTASQPEPEQQPAQQDDPRANNDVEAATEVIGSRFKVQADIQNPNQLRAGEPSGLTVKIYERDPESGEFPTAPDENYAGRLTFNSSTDPQAELPGPYTFTPSADKGIATFPRGVMFKKAFNAHSLTVTAVENGIEGTGALSEIVVRPGEPSGSKSDVVPPVASVPADGSSTANVTVNLKDEFGNDVPGRRVNLTRMSGPAGPLSIGTQSPGSDTTNSSGVATFAVKTTKAGRYTLRATACGSESSQDGPCPSSESIEITKRADLAFVAGAVNAAKSTLKAQPASVTADGSPSTITVSLMDKHDNPVADSEVSLAKTAGPTEPTMDPSNRISRSDSSGKATFAVSSTVAGKYIFKATSGSTEIGSVEVAFVPGVVKAAKSTVSADKASVRANGSDVSRIFVTLRDQHSNPVPGKTVSVSKSAGPGNPSISPSSATTNSSGAAVFSTKSTTAGKHTFKATDTSDGIDIGQTEVAFMGVQGDGKEDEQASGQNEDSNSDSSSGGANATSAESGTVSNGVGGTTASAATIRPATRSANEPPSGSANLASRAPTQPRAAGAPNLPGSSTSQSQSSPSSNATELTSRNRSNGAKNDAVGTVDQFGEEKQGDKPSLWTMLSMVMILGMGAGGVAWRQKRRARSSSLNDYGDGEESPLAHLDEKGEEDSSFSWQNWQASLTED